MLMISNTDSSVRVVNSTTCQFPTFIFSMRLWLASFSCFTAARIFASSLFEEAASMLWCAWHDRAERLIETIRTSAVKRVMCFLRDVKALEMCSGTHLAAMQVVKV